MTAARPRFADRVAIVTGAATGLGEAYARALADEGATVAIADLDVDRAERVVAVTQGAGGRALAVHVDVTDESSVIAMVEVVTETLGPIDVLVNNAAVMFRFIDEPRRPFWEYASEDWDLVMDVNVKGSWLCAKAVFPIMRERGSGKIVNVSSNMAFGTDLAFPAAMSAYTTSKAAVRGLTAALAGEAGPYGVTVNAVAPGATHTETTAEHIGADRMQEIARLQAVKREARPSDIVGTVLFLCSEASDFMTGQTLIVDGGFAS